MNFLRGDGAGRARPIPPKFLARLSVLGLAVGLLAFGWLANTPPGLLGKAEAIGYAVCHRIDLRSFHLGERAMPLCARCSGMYLGALVGLLFQGLRAPRRAGRPPLPVLAILGALVAAFGVDGLNSTLHLIPSAPTLYQPDNALRLLTGTGMGLAIAAAVYPAFVQTVWQAWDRRPTLPDTRSLAILLTLGLLVDLLVLTENPAVLYPLALLSAAGVVLILSALYTLVWVILLQRENRYRRWGQLAGPLVAGFGLALLQIALMDLGRFWLTGTWAGFHLG